MRTSYHTTYTPIITLPACITRSPCGFHTTDPAAFISTHPLPRSTDPDRLAFATPKVAQLLTSQFPQDAAGRTMVQLMIFNKAHARYRICPSCWRVYRVGEAARMWEGTFEAWLARPHDRMGPTPMRATGSVEEEQELSGICSRLCFELLTEVEAEGWSEARVDEWANRDLRASVGVPEDVALEGWRVKKTSAAEQAAGGG